MELFCEFFIFCKIHKKKSLPESLFNKVRCFYPAISLKEWTPIQVFSDECCEILKIPFFTEHLQATVLFYEKKYFTTRIVKYSLRKEKNWKQPVRKSHAKQKLNIKSSYPFTIQKFLSLFSASYDIFKTRHETMQSH